MVCVKYGYLNKKILEKRRNSRILEELNQGKNPYKGGHVGEQNGTGKIFGGKDRINPERCGQGS
jgi:hypothetical protein